MISEHILKPVFIMVALSVSACDGGDGLTTAEVEAAAKERVSQQLGLEEDAALFTNVFVGEPVGGDTVLCGTVQGRRSDGTTTTPRRFIAATDPARWVKFETATGIELPSRPGKFVEWHTTCRGEQEVR